MPETPLTDTLELVGKTIADKYAIESVVGQGGFAIVYRAMHLLWKVPVAVKVFSALGVVSREQRQQLLDDFLQEGRLLTQLSGRTAAILQARDVAMLTTGAGESVPYMVLEWLEGRSLDAVIDEERARGAAPRTFDEAVRLLDPIAEALAIAHEAGIVHRDLKPANIFVIGDPRAPSAVKLLDFGIAKVVQDAQKMGFTKTAGHVTSFTPYYGSPEQFDRGYGATSPATDVFAFALVLAELVSGREPMAGDSIVQLAYQACDTARRPTPRALGVPVSDDVEAVFVRALAVSPQERFPTAGAFWSALKAAISGQPWAPPGGARISAPGGGSTPNLVAPQAGDSARLSLAQTALAPGAAAPSGAGKPPALLLAGAGLLALGVSGAGAFFALRKPHDATAAGAPSASAALASGSGSGSASASASPALAKLECPEGMKPIPGGKVFMGADAMDERELADPRPRHQVTLSPYCMDTFEVTVAAFKAASDKSECRSTEPTNEWAGITARERKLYDPLCNLADPVKRGAHPMNCVEWDIAEEYCRAHGKRLPTEAEWEFAARSSDQRKYPWGNDEPTGGHLNACGLECERWAQKNKEPYEAMYRSDDKFPFTAPVGSFPAGASPFGVQDVVGNVWEWTADWHAPYDAGPQKDPKGPATGTERIARGGAWNGSYAVWIRPTHRFKLDPKQRSHGVGFRCAKPL